MRRIVYLSLLPLFLATALRSAVVSYSNDTSDFSNPERGFSFSYYYYGPGNSSNRSISSGNLSSDESSNPAGATNVTLIRRLYVLSGYTNSALDSNVLNDITNDFNAARSIGVKLVPRFAYNWCGSGCTDASQSIILNHISQLKPILQANEDVIAYMEAGFIGQWGEWHDSTNGLTDPNNNNSTAAESTILTALLGALPSDRMVAVRYPGYTLEIFNTTTPISSSQAFNGSNYSRCGTHDDCFEVDQYDAGTYAKGTSLGWSPAQFKSFLAQQNYSVAEGGESCGTSTYSSCSNSLADLQNMHWSMINAQYEPNVLSGWISGGCMPQIKTGLGYRYRMISSNVPSSANQGGPLSLSIQMTNDGFANCYNPRGLEVILRPSGQSGTGTALPVTESQAQNTDPRFWQPGQTYTVNITVTVPANLATGNYDVLLNLPDGKSSLYGMPAYSIHLADQGVWESNTGYNKLNQTISIVNCPACTATPSPTITSTPVPGTGNIISIDFVGGSATNGNPNSMAGSESAGQVAAINWNNAPGTSGSLSSLMDNSGGPTSANLSYSAGNGIWSTSITDIAGNNRMMKGYIDASNTGSTSVNVTNLSAPFTNNGYSVYVYFDGDNGTATRTGNYTIGSTTISGTDAANTNFSGSFTQASGGSNGNYVVFTNLNSASFTLTAQAGASSDAYPRAPINGIQIVANAPSGSPTHSPTFSATPTISPTSTPVCFQMISDFENGSGQLASPWTGAWYLGADTYGSTINAQYNFAPGAASTVYAAKIWGNRVADNPPANQWGYVTWGNNLYWPVADFDASAYQGIQFWFKGDGNPYLFKLKTANVQDYYYYCALIPYSGTNWTQVQIPFTSLAQQGGTPVPLALTQVTGVEIAENQPNVAFTYYMDQIRFYSACGAFPSATPSVSPTITATFSRTASLSATPTPSASPSNTPSATLSYSRTPSDTPAATASATPTQSHSITFTPSGTQSSTVFPSKTDTPSATLTNSPVATATSSPSSVISATPTFTQTVTLTATPSFSALPTATSSSTCRCTATQSATSSSTPTASPTFTQTASSTATPSATPSYTLTVSSTATPSITLSATPSSTPSNSSTVTPNSSSTPAPGSPTPSPSASPANTKTGTPSSTPTGSPSPVISATPTLTQAIGSPTQTPSASPISSKTASPSPTISSSPANSPSYTATTSLSPLLSATTTFTSVAGSPTQTPTPFNTPSMSPSPAISQTATPSSVASSPTPSPTTILLTPSSTTTFTSFTPTSTSVSTPSGTASKSATPTFTITATPSATFSVSLTATPSFTPSYTASLTPSKTQTLVIVSPTASPSPTFSPTASPYQTTRTLPPSDGGVWHIIDCQASPNPDPRLLLVKLAGSADQIRCRIYSKAAVFIAESWFNGQYQAGWNPVPLPHDFWNGLGQGVYYLKLSSYRQGQGKDAFRICTIYLSR